MYLVEIYLKFGWNLVYLVIPALLDALGIPDFNQISDILDKPDPMILKIITVPHPILLEKASAVVKLDKKTQKLIADMCETLLAQKQPIGVGLSASQVGVLERIFLVRPDEKTTDVEVCVNPEILELQEGSAKREPTLEGCLSIPSVWGHVLRAEKVLLSYMDASGKSQQRRFDGFGAVVAQHELDHLNGILFTQRVLEQGRELYKEIQGELQPYGL